MFDITNIELIKKIIDTKHDGQLIIPLYIKIYNNAYSLLEMDDIDNYSSSNFKLGFGTSTSIFNNNPYIQKYFIEFPERSIHNSYDEKKMVNVQYYVFESNYVDESISDFHKQINDYLELIETHLSDNHKRKKREMIDRMLKEGMVYPDD